MKNRIIELSQRKDRNGRRKVKIVLHEIYKDTTEYNSNGITWLEKYTKDNLSSAEGMPLVCQFIDDEKDVPLGHGAVEEKDGQVIFEDSIVVGIVNKAYVSTVKVNGEMIKAAIAEGYLFQNRYPKLVDWISEKIKNGENVESSVEIIGLESNDNKIIYEDGYKERGRVPMIYQYTGHAILSIPPSDDKAIILELNNKQSKEDQLMEKTVVELNEKIDAQRVEIEQLKEDKKQLSSDLKEKQKELNSTVEQMKDDAKKIEDKEAELEKAKQEKCEMEKELNELREFKQAIDNQKLVKELNSKLANYSDEEKEVCKDKIETFSKEPKQELMNEIISEINSSIAQKIVSERAKSVETNSKLDDIYSDMIETNSDNDVTIDDLY